MLSVATATTVAPTMADYMSRTLLELYDLKKALAHELELKKIDVEIAQEQTELALIQKEAAMVIAQETAKQIEYAIQLKMMGPYKKPISVSRVASEVIEMYVISEQFRNAILSNAEMKAASTCAYANQKIASLFGPHEEHLYDAAYYDDIERIVLEAYDQEAKKYEGIYPVCEVSSVD